jgi:hypothetical protein
VLKPDEGTYSLAELGINEFRIRFIADDPDFECAHAGQLARLWRINQDGSLYVELRCGHPYTLRAADLGILVERTSVEAAIEALRAKPQPAQRDEERKHMRTTRVANSKGVVPVQGFDTEVRKFKIDLGFLKQLEGQVETAKAKFREVAARTAEETEGEVKRIEFLSDDGSATVPVSLPDVEKQGNRTTIKDETRGAAARLGVALDELGVTETSCHYVLRGEFVDWLEKVLVDNYTSKGKPVPEGIEKKEETRLTLEGVAQLRRMLKEAKTENEREAARVILAGGLKAALVSAK